MKRLLSLMLVLVLILSYVGGLAESAKIEGWELVVDNFVFRYNGQKFSLNPSLYIAYQENATQGVMDFSIRCGDQTLLPMQFQVTMDAERYAEEIILALDHSPNAYVISREYLKELLLYEEPYVAMDAELQCFLDTLKAALMREDTDAEDRIEAAVVALDEMLGEGQNVNGAKIWEYTLDNAQASLQLDQIQLALLDDALIDYYSANLAAQAWEEGVTEQGVITYDRGILLFERGFDVESMLVSYDTNGTFLMSEGVNFEEDGISIILSMGKEDGIATFDGGVYVAEEDDMEMSIALSGVLNADGAVDGNFVLYLSDFYGSNEFSFDFKIAETMIEDRISGRNRVDVIDDNALAIGFMTMLDDMETLMTEQSVAALVKFLNKEMEPYSYEDDFTYDYDYGIPQMPQFSVPSEYYLVEGIFSSYEGYATRSNVYANVAGDGMIVINIIANERIAHVKEPLELGGIAGLRQAALPSASSSADSENADISEKSGIEKERSISAVKPAPSIEPAADPDTNIAPEAIAPVQEVEPDVHIHMQNGLARVFISYDIYTIAIELRGVAASYDIIQRIVEGIEFPKSTQEVVDLITGYNL